MRIAAPPSNVVYHEGIAYDGAAYLVDNTAGAATDIVLNGIRVSATGRIRVTVPGAAKTLNVHGWPVDSDGSVPMAGLSITVAVPAGTSLNAGIAMDQTAVYGFLVP